MAKKSRREISLRLTISQEGYHSLPRVRPKGLFLWMFAALISFSVNPIRDVSLCFLLTPLEYAIFLNRVWTGGKQIVNMKPAQKSGSFYRFLLV